MAFIGYEYQDLSIKTQDVRQSEQVRTNLQLVTSNFHTSSLVWLQIYLINFHIIAIELILAS